MQPAWFGDDRFQQKVNAQDIRTADGWWTLGLFLAAVPLFCFKLGYLPLRDWDEGIVAQVAHDIFQAPADSWRWLYPTLAGEPYFNKPPFMHWLIAIAFRVGGVSEWTARLPGAMLTAVSIPLLYWVGREIFSQRLPAILAALVYLTLLPVVRHGRLAMLDGPMLCFYLLMLWCLLRSRRDLRWALGVGIGFGLMGLTKGILGLLLGAIALVFVSWDTPRLLTSVYFWGGWLAGSAPTLAWYGAQGLHYGLSFTQVNLVHQSLNRIWSTVDDHAGPPWYYLLEMLKYGWPWLVFFPQGLRLAWQERSFSWAKLVLIWSGGYFLVISVMGTKLPWYVLPIYPVVALTVGMRLTARWQHHPTDVALPPRTGEGSWFWSAVLGISFRPPGQKDFPASWTILLALLALAGWGTLSYDLLQGGSVDHFVQGALVAGALTMTVSSLLMYRQDWQFLSVLVWGTYVSLVLFVASGHWNWELAEAYPVKPIAAMIRQQTSPEQVIYTTYPHNRPALNFYSERRVIPLSQAELQERWQQELQPYLLTQVDRVEHLNLPGQKQLESTMDWTLITRSPQ